MPAAQDQIDIAVSPTEFFKVISDYRSYPEFLSDVAAIDVEEVDGRKLVHYTIKIKLLLKTFTTTYTLQKFETPEKEVRWELDSSDDVIDNRGSWVLTPLADGTRTRACYTIDAFTYNIPIPQLVYDTLTKITLPRTIKAFKERAEKLFPPKKMRSLTDRG